MRARAGATRRLARRCWRWTPKAWAARWRVRAGPARDAWLTRWRALQQGPAPRRIPLNIEDVQLFGGLDLTATLASGRPALRRGLLEEDGPLILPMAERTRAGLAARLARAMDGDAPQAVVLLDEGDGEEESAPRGRARPRRHPCGAGGAAPRRPVGPRADP
jgi:magnesium chelatase subunit D